MRSKGRTALIAALVALPVLAGTVAIILVASAVPTQSRLMGWALGPEAQAKIVWIGDVSLEQGLELDGGLPDYYVPDEGPLDGAVPVSVVEERVLAALPAGSELSRTWSVWTEVTGSAPRPGDVRTTELDPRVMAGLVTLREGRLPAASDEAVVSRDVARRIGALVGSSVRVSHTNSVGRVEGDDVALEIVGIYDVPTVADSAGLMAPLGAILDLDAVERDHTSAHPEIGWFVHGEQPVGWNDVRSLNAAGAVVASRHVVDVPPPASDVSFVDQGADGGSSFSAATLSIGGAVAVFGLFEIIMLIGPAFAVGARRNERQLALVAAVGGDRRALRRIVLLGGVVIGGAASLGGIGGGIAVAAVARQVLNSRFAYSMPEWNVPPLLLLALAAFGTSVAVAAAWVPARRAGRMDVVAALAQRRTTVVPRRRRSLVAVGILGASLAAALLGAGKESPALMIGGVVGMLGGVVLLSGGVLGVIAHLAPRLGPAGRYAARDAVRQHARTAPALAAIVAAAAGVVAAGTFVSSKDAQDAAMRSTFVADGRVIVTTTGSAPDPDVVTALETTLPLADLIEVRTATFDPGSLSQQEAESAARGELSLWLSAVAAPESLCPLDGAGVVTDEATTAAVADDPRCVPDVGDGTPTNAVPWMGVTSTIVDDGTVMDALGLPGAADAARALRDGYVLVSDDSYLWSGDEMRLSQYRADYVSGITDVEPEELVSTHAAKAVALPLGTDVVLPPSVAAGLGLATERQGFVGVPDRPITTGEERAASAAVAAATDAEVWLTVERGFQSDSAVYYSLLLAAAVVVGAGATGIVLALSSAETRPDMATLGAIGAPPALRRRVAAAQAALVTVPGLVLGSVVGVAFAWVLVLTRQQESGGASWPFTVPWLELGVMVVGVPLVVMGGAYLLTRSRLPMIRRLTD